MNDQAGDSLNEDPPLGSTSAPFVDTADQVWIAELLGSLRSTQTQLPADVAARLDNAVAAEQAARLAAPEQILEKRPTRGWNTRWLTVAAAALVVIGGASIYRQTMSSTGSAANTSLATGETVAQPNQPQSTNDQAATAASVGAATSTSSLAPQSAQTKQPATDLRTIAATDRVINRANVGTTVNALLLNAEPSTSTVEGSTTGQAGAAAGGSTGMTPADATAAAAPVDSANPLTVPASRPSGSAITPSTDCLALIGAVPGSTPDTVITGVVFEGQTANIYLAPIQGDSKHIEVWVIAAACSTAQSGVLDHLIIPSVS